MCLGVVWLSISCLVFTNLLKCENLGLLNKLGNLECLNILCLILSLPSFSPLLLRL